jgi:hypothetical protein
MSQPHLQYEVAPGPSGYLGHMAGLALARSFVGDLPPANRDQLADNLRNVETNSDAMRWIKRALAEEYQPPTRSAAPE